MSTASLAAIEKQVLSLTEEERAHLAAQILNSLPPLMADEDGGLEEALRRDDELSVSPERGISLEELETTVRSRRSR